MSRPSSRAACRSLRGAGPARGRVMAGWPAASFPMPSAGGAHPRRRAEPRRELDARHRPGSSRAPFDRRAPAPRYRARNSGGEWWVDDPYSFGPVLGPMDDYYIGEGSHLRLFDKLGAHPMRARGRMTACTSPSGRPTPAACRGGRLQRLGRPPPPDAEAARHRHLGDLHSRRPRPAAATNTRSSDATASFCR
jgi:hypothetical protein